MEMKLRDRILHIPDVLILRLCRLLTFIKKKTQLKHIQ